MATAFIKSQIDPTAIFVQKPDKGDACAIKSFRVACGGGVTTQLIAAVPGKIIRILYLGVSAPTVTVDFNLQSNAVVTFTEWGLYQVRNIWKAETIGVYDSEVGQAVSAQLGAAGSLSIWGRYIEVTP